MAEYKSSRHAGLVAFPQTPVPAADWGGALRGVFDDYVAVGGEAAASTILIGRIPPNSRVVDAWIKHEAMGAGVTVDVGDGTDADRFFNDVNVAAAGVSRMTLATGLGWKNATNAPVDVVVTTAGGALTAAAVITLHLTTQGL